MDRDHLTDRLRYWFPILSAIPSSLLNLLSFAVGLGFSTTNLTLLSAIVILGLAIVSGIIVFTIAHFSIPIGTGENKTLETQDEVEIINETGSAGIYRHIEKFKILRDGIKHFRLNFAIPPLPRGQGILCPLPSPKEIPPYDVILATAS